MASITYRRKRNAGLLALCLLALIVGLVAGFGAVGLRALIAVIHNASFLGDYSWFYDANVHTPPSPWGPFIILVPVIGGIIVVFLVQTFAPEARGHGVPEVMDAIFYKEGMIRPIVVVIKSLASALSIGTGGSVGREGPIIQIGSAMGSSLGQILHLQRWQTITLVAAGAGAGIAATFNTPLGGVMFAVELMLPEISARTFLPVVLSTAAATYIGRLFFGMEPAFMVPMRGVPELFFPLQISFLPIYAFFGVLCGVASAVFIHVLEGMEDLFDAIPTNAYFRHILGTAILGTLFYVLLLTTGHYHVEGVGYATIQSILTGQMSLFWLLGILFVAKLLATTLCLGSGASGGIFSPSLFMGATLGGSFGALAEILWPNLSISTVPFALIGMASVVGGTTGAAMTAILMIFEMTHDYSITVPAVIAVAAAIGIRRLLSRESIYTAKLARRGQHIPEASHSHMFLIRQAREVMVPVSGTVSIEEVAQRERSSTRIEPASSYDVVMKGERVVGVVPAGAGVTEPLPITRFTVSRKDDFLQSVMQRMNRKNRKVAVVIGDHKRPTRNNVIGVITQQEIAAAIMAEVGA